MGHMSLRKWTEGYLPPSQTFAVQNQFFTIFIIAKKTSKLPELLTIKSRYFKNPQNNGAHELKEADRDLSGSKPLFYNFYYHLEIA